ncbi:hypothetical protein BVRB_1g016140 [Beta vulgaris subsp. vulgaris]|nr:hypothetical protein BVRB_1g016140 [Beta vulgaris subsp. vulgaris]
MHIEISGQRLSKSWSISVICSNAYKWGDGQINP